MHVTSLRVSVTDACNLRCRYCAPDIDRAQPSAATPLSLEQLGDAALWLVEHAGARSIRLTGGEPLVRPGLERLVARLAAAQDVHEVTLTTNGALLARDAVRLAESGLARVNVSIDSLDPQRFADLTRGGRVADTLLGIDAALAAGLDPLKLNSVLLRSTWREDVPALLDFAAARDVEIRFIELMRTGTARAWCEDEFVGADEVRTALGLEAAYAPRGASPARSARLAWRGRDVTVGWITPRTHAFCGACDRLRLDAHGRLRRCLMDPESLPFWPAGGASPAPTATQHAGAPDAAAVFAYLTGKRAPRSMDSEHAMHTIGG